jgi:hypothetical protein
VTFFKKYWRMIAALIATVGFLVYSLLGSQPATVAGLAKFMGFALTAILGLQLAESIDIESRFAATDRSVRTTIRQVVQDIEPYVSRIVELRDADAYADLFGQIKGDLRTYNPHHYESRATSFDEALVKQNMTRRHADPEFKRALILVCVGDDYGVKNFCRFIRRLRETGAEAKTKVFIRLSSRPFLAEPTFHIQQRTGTERFVIEFRMPALASGDLPRYYLVAKQSDVKVSLQSFFDAQWGSARELDLPQLFQELEKTADVDRYLVQFVQKALI